MTSKSVGLLIISSYTVSKFALVQLFALYINPDSIVDGLIPLNFGN